MREFETERESRKRRAQHVRPKYEEWDKDSISSLWIVPRPDAHTHTRALALTRALHKRTRRRCRGISSWFAILTLASSRTRMFVSHRGPGKCSLWAMQTINWIKQQTQHTKLSVSNETPGRCVKYNFYEIAVCRLCCPCHVFHTLYDMGMRHLNI